MPVTVTVSEPDPITVSATSTSVCLGGSTDISSSYTSNFNNFTSYTLSVSPETGSGITNDVTLTSAAAGTEPYAVTPTAAGTYVYTITAVDEDRGCTSVSTVTINVYSNPVITSFTATPSPVCAGQPVVLTAKSVGASGTATVGAGGSTTSSYNAPFYSLWSNKHEQILITASELSAAGLLAGNITSCRLPYNFWYCCKPGLFIKNGCNFRNKPFKLC